MVPDLHIARILATDISCFIGRIVAAYQQYWRQNVIPHFIAKSCSNIVTSDPDEVRSKLKEVPICPQILISEQRSVDTLSRVNQLDEERAKKQLLSYKSISESNKYLA
jgi:hypothetical protein